MLEAQSEITSLAWGIWLSVWVRMEDKGGLFFFLSSSFSLFPTAPYPCALPGSSQSNFESCPRIVQIKALYMAW